MVPFSLWPHSSTLHAAAKTEKKSEEDRQKEAGCQSVLSPSPWRFGEHPCEMRSYPGLFFFLLFGLWVGSTFSSRYCTTWTSEGTRDRKSNSSLLSMLYGSRSFLVNLFTPQASTMYLRGMKYTARVAAHRATMASQLRKGTVQLKVFFILSP